MISTLSRDGLAWGGIDAGIGFATGSKPLLSENQAVPDEVLFTSGDNVVVRQGGVVYAICSNGCSDLHDRAARRLSQPCSLIADSAYQAMNGALRVRYRPSF